MDWTCKTELTGITALIVSFFEKYCIQSCNNKVQDLIESKVKKKKIFLPIILQISADCKMCRFTSAISDPDFPWTISRFRIDPNVYKNKKQNKKVVNKIQVSKLQQENKY